jgi:hypothetical protein
MTVLEGYNSRFFVEVKQEVEEIENMVRERRGMASSDKVNEE